MPIVQPLSFDAMGLVGFQINAHYLDPDPNSTHQGETRAQRIAEYHEDNDRVVVGLREGSWLDVDSHRVTLNGLRSARIFRRGQEPFELQLGGQLALDGEDVD